MKNLFIAVVVIAFGVGFIFMLMQGRTSEIIYQPVNNEVIVDSYDRRVEELIASSTEDWKEKHRNWAEQEVTKQVMAEQEEKLKVLRQEELSF